MLAPKLLIFDVNETLLDMQPLKDSINTALENPYAFDIWFPQLLQYSLVETITGTYHDFSEIAAGVFKMTAQKLEKDFSDNEVKQILSKISELQPHEDVPQGLANLKEQGYILVALTNGKPRVALEQLEYAGLSSYFDKILSVEVVNKYKPAPETYNYVTKMFTVANSEAMLVAAHGWDITGAKRAGLRTAFVNRPGKSLYPLAESPDLTISTILELANSLNR